MNEKSYYVLAEILKVLGIDDIQDSQLDELERTWNDFPEVIMSEGSLNKMTLLLTGIGSGEYEFKTATWKPSSKHIFSFNMKAYDIENMYGLLLKGIETISDGELVFTNISEMSNSEIGIGNQIVSFDLNNAHYEFEAKINYDWYDVNIIPFLNKITKQTTKQLYFLTDAYQQVIVFYKDASWADAFEKATELQLFE